MKTLIYIFSTLTIAIFASINSVQAGVMAANDELRLERYSVLACWILFGLSMIITYMVWKKKSRAIINHTNKIRTRTYEMMDHGKRVIVTKKLPDSKKSKSAA